MRKSWRNLQIVTEFKAGETICVLAGRHGITRQRVQQILKRNGISGVDGGQFKTSVEKSAVREALDDTKHIARWGMTRRAKRRVIAGWRALGINVVPKYSSHKKNAHKRGIEFKLSFAEWLDVWGDLLVNCGIGEGKMVMCRKGDQGPYEIGNVFIGDAVENLLVGRLGTRQLKIFREIRCADSGDRVQG